MTNSSINPLLVKVCEKRQILREKKQQYVKREKEVLMLLSSNIKATAPFFVRLYCTFHDHNSLCKKNLVSRLKFNALTHFDLDFVLTRATNGDLLTYLQKAVQFELEVARFYAAELVHGVEHMHMLGIVHRDLKPENILLNSERHILITDFGSAKLIPQPPLLPGKFHTNSYEVLISIHIFNPCNLLHRIGKYYRRHASSKQLCRHRAIRIS